ncbi:hypothetical protein AB0K60_12070 [Thermopolyspora sp. NPDC052614]|uniref:hypothetical protein n=1 Tax=Thermopolyspora sp. NPDC052614 TaxID=3155682 RepID=UPI0034442E9E
MTTARPSDAGPPPEQTPVGPRPGPLWARAVTEILAPAHLVIALPLVIGWRATWPDPAGVWWGLTASLFCGIVPYAVILAGVRAGRLTDRHVVRRDQRMGPLALALASVVAGLAALLAFRATPAVVVLVLGMLGALVVIVPITTFWKISLHAAVAAGAATALTITFGLYAAAVGWPLVLLVAAARVALRVHTFAQVVAGALVGALVPLGVYLLAE